MLPYKIQLLLYGCAAKLGQDFLLINLIAYIGYSEIGLGTCMRAVYTYLKVAVVSCGVSGASNLGYLLSP